MASRDSQNFRLMVLNWTRRMREGLRTSDVGRIRAETNRAVFPMASGGHRLGV